MGLHLCPIEPTDWSDGPDDEPCERCDKFECECPECERCLKIVGSIDDMNVCEKCSGVPEIEAEFVVARDGRFVAAIDNNDGDIEYTADPRLARIFRGAFWREFWSQPHYRIMFAPPEPTS